jgi:cullin 3
VLPQGLVTDQVDFIEVWEVLSQSLREIHHKNASTLSFEALYRNAYKLVLKKHGDRLYQQVKELVTEHLQHVAVRDVKPLVPSNVVTGGGVFGSAAIEKRIGGSKFLEQLKAVWEDHQLCMGMITDVLMYMVKHSHCLCSLLAVPGCARNMFFVNKAFGTRCVEQDILRGPQTT